MDVYRKFNPFRGLFKLPDCKQSTLEKACGLFREDPFNGGELINVYKEYVKHPDEEALRVLLLHNLEDIKGLLHILPILAVHDLLHCPVHVKKVHAGNYTDHTGATKAELLMELELPVTLPFPVTTMFKQCYCKADGSQATIKIPIYTEEMKYFYPDYKEYYYLPDEDRAIHKSVSNFVSKESRVPAIASNCYVRKTAYFLPQWEEIFSPCFVRNYKDKDLFFELTNEVKKDRAGFDNYARHILSTILTS